MAATTKLKFVTDIRKRRDLNTTFEEAKSLLYDPENYEILGRNARSWGKIALFYLAFWGCLAIFMSICMAMFLYVVTDANYPMRQGMANLAKGNPGLSFRPLPDLETTLIRFIQGYPSSYKIHTDHIQAFLDQYENELQVGENFIDCSQGKTAQQEDKVCRFNIDLLGAECTWQKDYGYDEGQPCVLLKFNKLFGWYPEQYSSSEVPAEIRKVWQPEIIAVTCEGENPSDKENIGNITFYPPEGFPMYYFPYINQEGYRQPIVFARFENPANGVVISVWCKAWAKNIYHHRLDNAGSIHFELLVD